MSATSMWCGMLMLMLVGRHSGSDTGEQKLKDQLNNDAKKNHHCVQKK
jgi:hypothetical protein